MDSDTDTQAYSEGPFYIVPPLTEEFPLFFPSLHK